MSTDTSFAFLKNSFVQATRPDDSPCDTAHAMAGIMLNATLAIVESMMMLTPGFNPDNMAPEHYEQACANFVRVGRDMLTGGDLGPVAPEPLLSLMIVLDRIKVWEEKQQVLVQLIKGA